MTTQRPEDKWGDGGEWRIETLPGGERVRSYFLKGSTDPVHVHYLDDGEEAELTQGEVVEHVYECWVSTDQNSFAKLKSDEKYPIISWLTNALDQLPMHGHIHIVLHDAKEYQG